jgi:hypothetical protein
MALGVVLLFGPPASARNDPRHFFLPASPVDLDASFCGFPVHIDFPVNREYGTSETLANGTTVLHVRGALVDVLSSPTATITLNASGPGELYFAPDGTVTIVARGLSIFPITAEQQAETGLPGLIYTRGLVVLRLDPDGSAELIRQEGAITSLCAQLA